MSASMSDTNAPSVEDRVTARLGDGDHFLRHVTSDDTTFSGRHERHVDTETTPEGLIVHKVVESYSPDAHGESLSWKRGVPSGDCPFCTGTLDAETGGENGRYVETATCDTCPFTVRRASVDASLDSPDYMKPLFFRATVPHDFNDEPDVDWAEMRENLEGDDADVADLANVVRVLHLQKYVGVVRDAAYDSDEKAIQTVECANCGAVVDAPAAETHAHYGDVCPDCADATVWSPEEADLPDDVADRMAQHASFTPAKLVKVLRDALFYGAYTRTGMDDEEKAAKVPEGVTTGRGGKIDAQAMGRGVKGTGLRRPSGPFHGDAHWRTVLADAKETGLIERADDADVDDEHKDARWTATGKGREVFDALARCETCGAQKAPYKRVRVYQTQGRHTKKDARLTLACADCDQMQSQSRGMTIASSTGKYGHQKLDGVDYDE